MNKFYLTLVKLGLRGDLTGTKYLAYLCEIYDDKFSLQELYTKIAEKFNVSTIAVERNIRTCIDRSWYTLYHLTIKNILVTFNEHRKPTNKLFIKVIIYLISSYYKNNVEASNE